MSDHPSFPPPSSPAGPPWRTILTVLAVCAIAAVVLIAANGSTSPVARALVPHPIKTKLHGSWDAKCEAGPINECSSDEAAPALEPTEISCAWHGRNVIVHVQLRSHFNARLEVGIVPRYEIADGGTHGTSFGSDRSKRLPPQGQVTFDINAGHPEGVPAGTPISDCRPKLYDVDLIPLS